jgi:hypothetical protein
MGFLLYELAVHLLNNPTSSVTRHLDFLLDELKKKAIGTKDQLHGKFSDYCFPARRFLFPTLFL